MADSKRRIAWAGGHLASSRAQDVAPDGDITDTTGATANSAPDAAHSVTNNAVSAGATSGAPAVAPTVSADGPPDISNYITIRRSERYVDVHVRKTYYIRPELYDRLTRLSKELNIPMSEVVNDALALFFHELDKAAQAKKGATRK